MLGIYSKVQYSGTQVQQLLYTVAMLLAIVATVYHIMKNNQ